MDPLSGRRFLIFVAFIFGLILNAHEATAQLPSDRQVSAFTGAWCAQGDPTKHASISSNGVFLALTNENGDTSTGQLQGQTGIMAPGWQFVSGNLSSDGSRIDWSNGTYWARCRTGGGGRGGPKLDLTGTWYAQGDRSRSCSIQQNGRSLRFSNESGDRGDGRMTDKRQLTSNWNGNTIEGSVTPNGNRINWTNGSYWTRIRVYGP